MKLLEHAGQVHEFILNRGWLRAADGIRILPMSGGVSSFVWKIECGEHRYVLKQARLKLNVKEDWFSDPSRIVREYKAMVAAAAMLPSGSVPDVLHADDESCIYLMSAASEDSVPWKKCLMDQQYDWEVAEHVGRLLSRLHRQSAQLDHAEKKPYMDIAFFRELRIDPFYLFLAAKYPSSASIIHQLADQLTRGGTCLVHGDYTPKNMLINSKGEVVLLDFEVIHWGNPVFDVALCLCHLILKGWYSGHYEEFRKLIDAFQVGYGSLHDDTIVSHIGLLLLARLEGKSPVEYIHHDELKNQIRHMAFYGLDQFLSGERMELADYLNKFWR